MSQRIVRERTRHREIGTQIDSDQDRVHHNSCFLHVPDRGTAHQSDGKLFIPFESTLPQELRVPFATPVEVSVSRL